MKRRVALLVLLALTLLQWGYGQGCVIDSQLTSVGIYPNDTLPPMQPGTTIDVTFNILLPADTVLFGFNLPFDSVTLAGVMAIPNYLTFGCGGAGPSCFYAMSPDSLYRTCMRFTGTCTSQSPRFPAYDSIVVRHAMWTTLPFGVQAVLLEDTLYYRCGTPVGVKPPSKAGRLSVLLNEWGNAVGASWSLDAACNASLEVQDVCGHAVGRRPLGWMEAGEHRMEQRWEGLQAGIYVLLLRNDAGEVMAVAKWRQL